jgi:hypothetical protein
MDRILRQAKDIWVVVRTRLMRSMHSSALTV